MITPVFRIEKQLIEDLNVFNLHDSQISLWRVSLKITTFNTSDNLARMHCNTSHMSFAIRHLLHFFTSSLLTNTLHLYQAWCAHFQLEHKIILCFFLYAWMTFAPHEGVTHIYNLQLFAFHTLCSIGSLQFK